MKIIYISAMISEKKFAKIFKHAKEKPLQSIQKYHRLLCKGLVSNNVETEAISVIPMSRKISTKLLFFDKQEKEDGIKFTYVPFINIKFVRQLFTIIFSFIIILIKILKNFNKATFVCDVLNTNLSFNTVLLCKIFNQKCVALVTDLPKDINPNSLNSKINQFLVKKYDGYILLTDYMNEVVNYKKRPYVIVEGLVDNSIDFEKVKYEEKKEKICVYTGGLYEKYGILELIKAFDKINKNFKLHLYGQGDLVKHLKNNKYNNVCYKGILKNDEIIKVQQTSTLLINPRFSNEDYTKYSFPSKTIEYMVSGRPVLTTKLKGIPKEYNKYLYFFDSENSEGFKNSIEFVLSKSNEELSSFGFNAKKFVLTNKNNLVQSKKVIEMISFMKGEYYVKNKKNN